MSILVGFNTRDSKLGAKIYNMALARSSFGMNEDDLAHQAFDRLCVEELDKTFEQYNQKHIKNGFGAIDLLQIKNRGDALVCAYRCNHKAERY